MKSWIPVDVAGLVGLQVQAAVVPAGVTVNTLSVAGVHLQHSEHSTSQCQSDQAHLGHLAESCIVNFTQIVEIIMTKA